MRRTVLAVFVVGLVCAMASGPIWGDAVTIIKAGSAKTVAPVAAPGANVTKSAPVVIVGDVPIPQRASVPDYNKTQLIIAVFQNSVADQADPLAPAANPPGEPVPVALGMPLRAGVFLHVPNNFANDAKNIEQLIFDVLYNPKDPENRLLYPIRSGAPNSRQTLVVGQNYFMPPTGYSKSTVAFSGQFDPDTSTTVNTVQIKSLKDIVGGSYDLGYNVPLGTTLDRIDVEVDFEDSVNIPAGTYFLFEVRIDVLTEEDIRANFADAGRPFTPGECKSLTDQIWPDATTRFFQPLVQRSFPVPDRLADTIEVTVCVPPERMPKLEPAQFGFYETNVLRGGSVSLASIPHAANILPLLTYDPAVPGERTAIQFPPFLAYYEAEPGIFYLDPSVGLDVVEKKLIFPASASGRYWIAFAGQSDVPPSFDFNVAWHDFGWTAVGVQDFTFAGGSMKGTAVSNMADVRSAFLRPELQVQTEGRTLMIKSSSTPANAEMRVVLYSSNLPTNDAAIIAQQTFQAGGVDSFAGLGSAAQTVRSMAIEILTPGAEVSIDYVRFQD